MNQVESVTAGKVQGRNRRWLTLVLLFLLFAAPMIAAYLWRPSPDAATINYGQLVSPARPPLDIPLQSLEGKVMSFLALKGKWTLLYVGATKCEKFCKNNLYKIERVRLTQSKNMDRVQSVYLVPEQITADNARERLSEYVGVTGMLIDAPTLSKLKTYLEQDNHGPVHERIYFIDPLGNLMMSYPADADPTGMRKDLARLLKVSQVG